MEEKFDSKAFWIANYKKGRDSGSGSRGMLAQYKADIVNQFVKDNKIKSVCELGCGISAHKLWKFKNFTGYDICEQVIEENKKFGKFIFTANFDELGTYELMLSMDVIYHLTEDENYFNYMKELFGKAERFVCIYSPDINKMTVPQVRYRNFTREVPGEFELIQFIDNPHKGELTISDFYFYQRK
jgi:hypothetical protein